MLNFGKVSVTKGLGEWIALHKRMAPKMSEAGMFFRFVAADPNEETLFIGGSSSHGKKDMWNSCLMKAS